MHIAVPPCVVRKEAWRKEDRHGYIDIHRYSELQTSVSASGTTTSDVNDFIIDFMDIKVNLIAFEEDEFEDLSPFIDVISLGSKKNEVSASMEEMKI